MRRAAVACLVVMLAGCGDRRGGTLQARWTSIDTTLGSAKLRLPVHATWCQARARLQLLAVSGDTGIGLMLRTFRLAPGRYDVRDTSRADVPGATLALRVARGSTMFALSGDSGVVAVTSAANERLTGRFVGWFTPAGTTQRVLLSGSFADVRVVPDSVRCESTLEFKPATPSVVP